jgi:hypothetical protein
MRGDPHAHFGYVEDLPDDQISGRPGRRVEAVTAAAAHSREMRDFLVRDRLTRRAISSRRAVSATTTAASSS